MTLPRKREAEKRGKIQVIAYNIFNSASQYFTCMTAGAYKKKSGYILLCNVVVVYIKF